MISRPSTKLSIFTATNELENNSDAMGAISFHIDRPFVTANKP
jgi:hypothetical protein